MERIGTYINGAWCESGKGDTIDVIDPATEAVIGVVHGSSIDDVDQAVTAARTAFETGWGISSGAERSTYLNRFAACINDRMDELARLEVTDNGKPFPEAQWDVDDAANCFSMYSQLAQSLDARQNKEIPLSDTSFRSHIRYEPVGVAGQIIPWNYPLLMAAWKVAPALAAGATVVLKPSELTSLTALELANIATEIDLPPGVLNIVTGYGKDVGEALAQHPGVDKIAFTGSVPTGAHIMRGAADQIKNISLELGGKSPFIVFDDCDIEAAVEWIMFGVFWNQGQVCSATSRVLIHESIYSEVIDRLVDECKEIPIGDGMTEGVLLGPLVSDTQQGKVLGMIDRAVAAGANLLTGGGRPADLPTGYYVQPTVLADVSFESEVWREEIFGPVVCVAPFSREEEAVYLANDTRFGLAAAIMSQDVQRCERVSKQLRAGIVWINCSQPTFSEAPWGGFKQSGIGRELGQWGLDNYLEIKQVTRYDSNKPWGWYLNSL